MYKMKKNMYKMKKSKENIKKKQVLDQRVTNEFFVWKNQARLFVWNNQNRNKHQINNTDKKKLPSSYVPKVKITFNIRIKIKFKFQILCIKEKNNKKS